MLRLLKQNSFENETLEHIIKSNFASSLPFELFENELKNCERASTARRYSDELKQFCLTLHFYSPRAYEFIRKRSMLPDVSTIRRWLATRHCKPGILHEVLSYFKSKLQAKSDEVTSGKELYRHFKDVALIYDAMAIRSGRWYDFKNDTYSRYVDLGGIGHVDTEEFASEALVFMIVSYTHRFKCPVAYFLINKINASVQSELVLAVITALYEVGVTARSLTSDGTTTNLNTYENLGCSLNVDHLQPFFTHPQNSSVQIHCIMDPCHMIKLCRNCMSDTELSSGKGSISFKYVRQLHDLQKEIGLRFANKLTSVHIFYNNKKMSVRLATQVISSSVADALEFLQKHRSTFSGAAATIEFIRIFDRLFDVMNVRNRFGKGFKSPLTLKNYVFWGQVFEDAAKYIRQLHCNGQLILQH